ncbi:potassium channel family protein [Natronocalculus amylovorans]|uniref:TrkA C-terminal domain-containing protein n=1 Tax=Natronocalculus amylovorans TaxID=2917812 RepID=A0AAE3K7T4_9EURY|nr:TrkA C-terminal domain-containing protein [Natronocalculus amylovorans]MCL9816328.1 TrkA C-terminal domain-containing protein [Natronocalculus amylovorans]NUE03419.1 TrkA C-terminal domain-containing protein [Halorubraceae archaeon YAN]
MALPFEILLGIYLGVLTGIIPAVIAGLLGFVFKYFTGVTIPGLGVVVLALAIAGVNGGLMALADENIQTSENAVAVVTAIIVVLMLSLYAHSQGDKLGANVPRKISLRKFRDRTLNTDVVELVGGRNQVRVTVIGEIGDLEGYPPLTTADRTAIKEGEWTFPADIPIEELETRFADRLRSELDLADVSANITTDAKATVSAAPPAGSTSKRVPKGKRAVSISAVIPGGLARGEHVQILTKNGSIAGELIAAKSGEKKKDKEKEAEATATTDVQTDGGTDSASGATQPLTTGGEGRITVAVPRSAAKTLLQSERGTVIVLSRGTRREFELATILRQAGARLKKVTVVAGGPLDGTTIGENRVRETYRVVIIAAKHERWQVTPSGSQPLSAGDDLYVIGTQDDLRSFTEAAA